MAPPRTTARGVEGLSRLITLWTRSAGTPLTFACWAMRPSSPPSFCASSAVAGCDRSAAASTPKPIVLTTGPSLVACASGCGELGPDRGTAAPAYAAPSHRDIVATEASGRWAEPLQQIDPGGAASGAVEIGDHRLPRRFA